MRNITHIALFVTLLASFEGSAQRAFIRNEGQWPEVAKFKLPMGTSDMWLEPAGWVLTVLNDKQAAEAMHALHGEAGSTAVDGHTIRMKWNGAQIDSRIQTNEPKPFYYNYFIGNNSSRWTSHVQLFDRLEYTEIYEGISAHFELASNAPKITYEVEPGADPSLIRMEYSGHRGVELSEGNLIIKTTAGNVEEQGLLAFQYKGNEQVFVECRFEVKGSIVGFKLGKYDKSLPLYIDPTVIASTNSGCTSEAFGHTATFNENGQIYSAGRGFGTGYPTDTGAFQADFAGPFTGNYYLQVDMCLSKYNQDGSQLIYATYLGGNAEDLPHSMIANSVDHIVILGSTNSTDFPVSNGAFDITHNGGKDIFITSLTADGSQLVGSTYVGGSSVDGVNNVIANYADDYRGEVVLDDADNIYIASFSRSTDFPVTSGVYQSTKSGFQDGVVCKFTPDLSTALFSTFVGGDSNEAAYALKVDDSSNVYVAGVTHSADFPVLSTGAFNAYIGGATDGFVLKLNPTASTLLASSFFGTTSADRNYLIEIGSDGGVYLYGTSNGGITSTAGKYAGPSTGAYVYRTNTQLSNIEWISSFGDLAPAAFLVDNCNRIYMSGQGALSTLLAANFDTLNRVNALAQAGFYLLQLSPDAENLEFATFYGNNSSHVDGGTSRFDKRGVVYQATCSVGTFPTTSWAYSTTNQCASGGQYDNTVFKIDFDINVAEADIVPGDSACAPFVALFDNSGSVGGVHFWNFGDGNTSTDSMPTHVYDTPGIYDIFYVIHDTAGCYEYDTAFLTLTVIEPILPQIIVGDTHCVSAVELSVDTSFVSVLWSNGDTTYSTFVSTNGTYTVQTTEALFCVNSDTVDLEFIPAYTFQLPPDTTICTLGFSIAGPDSAVSYAWNTGDTVQSTLVNSTGLYILTASDELCTWVDTMLVSLSYVRFSTNDTALCADSIELTYEGTPGTILWSNNATSPSITVSASGTYWVTVVNGICVNSDTINVSFNPSLVSLGPDTVVCNALALSFPGFDGYSWSTGENGDSVFITSSGIYWLQVSDGDCTDRDSIQVTVHQMYLDSSAYLACDEDTVELQAPFNDVASYLWSTGDTTALILATEPGSYWVRIMTPVCENIDTVNLRMVFAPDLNLGKDTLMCIGEQLNLPIDSAFNEILWSTGESSASLQLLDSGSFWVSVNYGGCIYTDSIHIGLRDFDPLKFAMVANVITPNEDGLNDVLKLRINDEQLIKAYQLEVFNRWGNRVFESSMIGHHWDGTLPSGEPVTEGTYYYIMKCETVCTQKRFIEIRDNVTVLRK